jgi:hypothetical protein
MVGGSLEMLLAMQLKAENAPSGGTAEFAGT